MQKSWDWLVRAVPTHAFALTPGTRLPDTAHQLAEDEADRMEAEIEERRRKEDLVQVRSGAVVLAG